MAGLKYLKRPILITACPCGDSTTMQYYRGGKYMFSRSSVESQVVFLNGVKSNDILQICNANYSILETHEDLVVIVGKKHAILIEGGAGLDLPIIGTIEGGADKTILTTRTHKPVTIEAALSNMVYGGIESITNYGNRVTIDGGAGNDTLDNNGSNATLNGGSGDDVISNTAISVTIQGGAGYDTITNTNTNVSINAGDGNDRITNSGVKVTINAGKGADSVVSSGDTVSISGGDSRDSIFASGSNVTINGGGGDPIFKYHGEIPFEFYGDGNDMTAEYSGRDTLKITGAKYATLTSGANIKVKIGNDAILLRNAVDVGFKIEGTLESAEEANVLRGKGRVTLAITD